MAIPSGSTIALFMLSAWALNASPGPSILFILSRCMSWGTRAAIISVFGLAAASLIQAFAAAFGLAALFIYSPLAFEILRYCGAAYLIYLGVRSATAPRRDVLATTEDSAPSLASAFWQGVFTDLLNPKLLMFFFAFLPQFVDPGIGEPRSQMIFLGLLFQVTAVPTNLIVAIAGGSLARMLARHPFWARAQAWFSSAVLIGLGLKLALSERP